LVVPVRDTVASLTVPTGSSATRDGDGDGSTCVAPGACATGTAGRQ
jgi:hypothetical protein